jgi:hypothetical protein
MRIARIAALSTWLCLLSLDSWAEENNARAKEGAELFARDAWEPALAKFDEAAAIAMQEVFPQACLRTRPTRAMRSLTDSS